MKKLSGQLVSKTESSNHVDVKIGELTIRAWRTQNVGGHVVPNPVISELLGCRLGDFVEAEYTEKESPSRITGKMLTYRNLVSIAIQSCPVPSASNQGEAAKSDGQTKKTWGKTAEERREIGLMACQHDAVALWGPVMAAQVAEQGIEYFYAPDNLALVVAAVGQIRDGLYQSISGGKNEPQG